MNAKLSSLVIKFGSFLVNSRAFSCLSKNPLCNTYYILISTFKSATCSTISQTQVETVSGDGVEQPANSVEVLRRYGCSDDDIEKMLLRRPALRNANLSQLQSKLSLLWELGITSNDLVKIINCRPRLLSVRINHFFDERLEYFMTLFGSRELLLKAIIRNPSLLTNDFHNRIKPVIALYEGMGIGREDLVPLLLSRPTLISRTSFNDEKMECIRKSGASKESNMFKHVVCIIGISRNETICEKAANIEKFGMSNEEVWLLIGRSPYLLTLSVDKVQRNMTFVVGTLKLPANVILEHPFLLYNNLEAVLKPRWLLAGKIEEMGLCPRIKGSLMLRALRMAEKRFLKAFVSCHPDDVAKELMEFYIKAKCVKRLAEGSKKEVFRGFPF
ncbi:unnamed protein product [Dovyalis caffra]|uniref:Uncharacterized protein n=1 Tax=Dovyalis caffra TaxID=77055 RepID=A0AAV1SRV0_9ROSI|nr:unnamed protein product [Dovyalis caffra]